MGFSANTPGKVYQLRIGANVVFPIEVGLPLSVTIPSLTFPGLTIPQIPLGQGLSGALPAFDLPSITIDRIPISFAGPLTLF